MKWLALCLASLGGRSGWLCRLGLCVLALIRGGCEVHELQPQDEEDPQEGDDSQGLECLGRHDRESAAGAPDTGDLSRIVLERLGKAGEDDGCPFEEDTDYADGAGGNHPSYLLAQPGIAQYAEGNEIAQSHLEPE